MAFPPTQPGLWGSLSGKRGAGWPVCPDRTRALHGVETPTSRPFVVRVRQRASPAGVASGQPRERGDIEASRSYEGRLQPQKAKGGNHGPETHWAALLPRVLIGPQCFDLGLGAPGALRSHIFVAAVDIVFIVARKPRHAGASRRACDL